MSAARVDFNPSVTVDKLKMIEQVVFNQICSCMNHEGFLPGKTTPDGRPTSYVTNRH